MTFSSKTFGRYGVRIMACAAVALLWASPAPAQDPATTLPDTPGLPAEPRRPLAGWDRWSFQLGVAMITDNTVDDLLAFESLDQPKGDARGQIYLLGASYTLHEFDATLFGTRVRPTLQLPAVLGIVDEDGRSPFFQYNLGVSVRWRDFPWNHYVYTNLETGVGLTYSEHVLGTERQRHPDRDRSHLEIYWPVELTLAHPSHREHQLVFFLHHHSGGRIFHEGGANSLGIGYRWALGER